MITHSIRPLIWACLGIWYDLSQGCLLQLSTNYFDKTIVEFYYLWFFPPPPLSISQVSLPQCWASLSHWMQSCEFNHPASHSHLTAYPGIHDVLCFGGIFPIRLFSGHGLVPIPIKNHSKRVLFIQMQAHKLGTLSWLKTVCFTPNTSALPLDSVLCHALRKFSGT